MAPRRNPGGIVDKMFKIREDIRARNKKIKELELQYRALKEELLVRVEDVGSDIIRGSLATATVSPRQVANVVDWEAFGAWVYENQAIHFLYRRVNVAPVREYLERQEEGATIPGVETLELPDISLRVRSAK
jgi:hypothetical protein